MAITINGDGTITGLSLSDSDLPSGSVLQVVNTKYATQVSTGAQSFTDSGLSGIITPSSTSSKILVTVNQYLLFTFDTTSSRKGYVTLLNGSSVIGQQSEYYFEDSNQPYAHPIFHNVTFLDSPSTTSAVTYKTQMKVSDGSCDVYAQHAGAPSWITLMEIAG